MCALAYQAKFEGLLLSGKLSDPPLPIALKLNVSLAGVSGEVTTALPAPGKGALRGTQQFGHCDLYAEFLEHRVLRMKGQCNPAMRAFEGTYTIKVKGRHRQAGTFKLTRTSEPGESDKLAEGHRRGSKSAGAAPSGAQCLELHGTCLRVCSQVNYDNPQYCVNRCKRRLRECEARASGRH
jgi:hypothetical protein